MVSKSMRAAALIALAASAASAPAPFSQPSFLFILGDDIGWADFAFPNNGTAKSPNLAAWANAPGSVYFQDFHTGGTVCSPTRATVLTGRNHFRAFASAHARRARCSFAHLPPFFFLRRRLRQLRVRVQRHDRVRARL